MTLQKRAFDKRIFDVDVRPAMRNDDRITTFHSTTLDDPPDTAIRVILPESIRAGNEGVDDTVNFRDKVISFLIVGGEAGTAHDILIRFAAIPQVKDSDGNIIDDATYIDGADIVVFWVEAGQHANFDAVSIGDTIAFNTVPATVRAISRNGNVATVVIDHLTAWPTIMGGDTVVVMDSNVSPKTIGGWNTEDLKTMRTGVTEAGDWWWYEGNPDGGIVQCIEVAVRLTIF